MKIYFTLLFAALTIYVASAQNIESGQPSDVRIENSKIIYQTGSFETHLFDLEYVGQFKAVRKKPFLIFIGRPCDSCDVNNSIYIHSPSDGPLLTGKKQKRYNLPGPINDYQTRELLYVARLFWGEVIPGRIGMIWYQKELKNTVWVESVYFAELVGDRIVDEFIKSELKVSLAQVQKGKAWEIIGEPMNSEP
jgi:hypothetical protein